LSCQHSVCWVSAFKDKAVFHIIEDSEPIRTMLAEIVESLGRHTVSFACPNDYLKYVSSSEFVKPTAVITDVHMPSMTGYQMMEKVLELFPDLNFAVTSGEPQIDSRSKDKVCMYLVKPFNPELIAVMVDKFTRCQIEGASTSIGCAEFGDKAQFGLNACSCPKMACMKHEPK